MNRKQAVNTAVQLELDKAKIESLQTEFEFLKDYGMDGFFEPEYVINRLFEITIELKTINRRLKNATNNL